MNDPRPLAGARGYAQNSAPSPGSHERQRVDAYRRKSTLPRLPPEFYRGESAVHWTLTIEQRRTGWLDAPFHHRWQEVLLHASSRFRLICPAFVLMPDHVHSVWLGLDERSDQRVAIAFLRQHLTPHLVGAEWQHRVHDHILRQEEGSELGIQSVAHYVFENPVRAGLVKHWGDYPFLGACVPGYPEFDPRMPNFWARFWRCYNYLLRVER